MSHKNVQSQSRAAVLGPAVWALAARQHGVVTRLQLLELGFSSSAIKHRITRGRLHPVFPGVYAVGRPQLTREGYWMAALLACGNHAALSHESAAALWGIRDGERGRVEVSIPDRYRPRARGVRVHRRAGLRPADLTRHCGIPVTSPVRTLVDLARCLPPGALEAAVNAADKRDLATPEELRRALEAFCGQPGVARLRRVLDRDTFVLTDSELERRFLPLARSAGLPRPETGRRLNGFKVDFYWPELGLVVETDGLRYHRTPAQQAKDRRRDQAHAAAGLTPLRFTHAQVRFEPASVRATLLAVADSLRVRRLER